MGKQQPIYQKCQNCRKYFNAVVITRWCPKCSDVIDRMAELSSCPEVKPADSKPGSGEVK